MIYTDYVFNIQKTIVGQEAEGATISTTWPGGKVGTATGGISGYPVILDFDSRLFFMEKNLDGYLILQAHYRLPSDISLPDSNILKKNWTSACNSFPDGIYFLRTPIETIIDRIKEE